MGFVQVEVHRQQLDGGDAQACEVLDDGRVRHAGVRAAEFLRHVGVEHALPADVGLINDRVAPRRPRTRVGSPVEIAGHPDVGQESFPLVHGAAVGIEQQRLAAVVVQVKGGHGERQRLLCGRRPEPVPRPDGRSVDDSVVDAVGDVGQRLQPPLAARGLVRDLQAGHAGRVHGNVGPGLRRRARPVQSGRGTLTPSGSAVEASMVEAVSKSGMTIT